MERITIRAFRAMDEPELCEAYLKEHRKVLTDFGVTEIIATDDSWTRSPGCFVIIAEHNVLGMVGGIRLQRAAPSQKLPMEDAIWPMDHRIHSALAPYRSLGIAEVCGLWNAHRFAGRGLPTVLSMAAVSLANQVDVRVVTCFVAHYTLRHALKVGFTILEDVGDGGTFTYPIPQIRSIAMMIPDALRLQTAQDVYRQRLLSLRMRPIQEVLESPSGTPFMVRYILHVDPQLFDLRIYSEIQSVRLRLTA